jgi:hypothetical protein
LVREFAALYDAGMAEREIARDCGPYTIRQTNLRGQRKQRFYE